MKTKNKSFKRLFAFLVALVMVTALVPSVIFAADPTFTDVKSTDWFYEHVENLAANGIVSGYKGTKEFKPNNPVTRQEAAKMIALGAKTPAASGTEFTDLLGNWADPYIMALEADGAVSGFAGTKEFKPLENIKRGHVAKMIALAFGLKEGSEDYDLTDIKGVDNEDYIKILASNGIVGGFKGTTLFKPNELVTRAQMAKMIDVAMSPVDSTFRVLDVRAINGKEVEIVFSQKVDADTVINGDKALITEAVNIAPVAGNDQNPGTLTPTFDKDGKVLTLTAASYFQGKYTVTATTNVKNTEDPAVKLIDYSSVLTVSDTTPPSVVKVEAEDGKAEITFDEALNGMPAVSVNGNNAPSVAFKANSGNKVLVISDLTDEVTYDVEIVGARDAAGNIADPISLTFTVAKKGVPAKQDVTISASGNKVTLVFVNEITENETIKFAPADFAYGTAAKTLSTIKSASASAITISKDEKTVVLDAQLLGVFGKLDTLETKVTVGELGSGIDPVEKTVSLTADRVAPKFVKATAKHDRSLTLEFDKAVAIDELKFDVTHVGGILLSAARTKTIASSSVEYAKVAGEDVLTKLVFTLPASSGTPADLKAGEANTILFEDKAIVDIYGNENDEFTTVITVPLTDAEADTEIITVTATVAPAGEGTKTITLGFAGNTKDLTDASALAANFTLGGKQLPAGTKVDFVNNKSTIRITLPAGSIVTTGQNYKLTLANIADLDGNTLAENEDVKYINLVENVAPTVKTVAAGTVKTVVVTFSEKIKEVASPTTVIVVKVNGEVVAQDGNASISLDELTITLASSVDPLELGDKISVEFKTPSITDLNSNAFAKGTFIN